MNKENDVLEISFTLDSLKISPPRQRLTRSASRLQATNKVTSRMMVEKNRKVLSKVKEVKEIKVVDNLDEKKRQMPKTKVENKGKPPSRDTKIKIGDNCQETEEELIVCRKKEISAVTTFLMDIIDGSSSGSLYISGSPGTGKTSVVTSILSSMQRAGRCRYHLVTCMDFSQPMGVFLDIWSKFGHPEVTNATLAATEIEDYLKTRTRTDRPLVIVLDEVDQLACSNQRILYRIFKWVELVNCRLIIIGIANTLDLTTSQLQDISLEMYKPHHINFPPYNETELADIIMSRVKVELTPSEKIGVTFCSKKISSKNGDARMALDLYKRAATISEDDELVKMRTEALEMATDSSEFHSPMKRVLSTPQLLSMRRSQFITPSSPCIKHVNRAIKEVEVASNPYRNIVNVETGQSTLPLHHKLVLCAALVLSKQRKSKPTTLGQLYDTYSSVCKSQDIGSLGMSELVNICDLLDTRALMKVRAHKEIRQKVFTLNLERSDIESALSDNSLLTSIMSKFCL